MNKPEYTLVEHKKIQDLKEAWERLYAGNRLLSPYQSYGFCEIVFGDFRFSHHRLLLRPVFLEILRDGVSVILVPLWRKSAREYYLFPDFCLAGYLDFIYDAGCSDADFEAAIRLTKENIGGAELVLRRVNDQSLLYRYLNARYEQYGEAPCVEVLFENGYDEYYKRLSKNTRQNIRTAYNRLAHDGKTVRLEVKYDYRPDEALWREVIRLHTERYRVRDGVKNNFLMNYVKRNHDPMETALKTLPRNGLFLLYIDSALAAFFASHLSNSNSVVVPRLSYNEELAFYSPGILLIIEAVKYLAQETDIRRIDLSHGSQKYKYVMGGQDHFNHYYRI